MVNLTRSQVYPLLQKGALPARKVGAQYVASRRKLLEAVGVIEGNGGA